MSKRKRQHKDTRRRDQRDRAQLRERRAIDATDPPTDDTTRDYEPEPYTPE